MKTTIEIPDTTFQRAKSLAGSQGITLKQLFTQAIEARIRSKPSRARSAEPEWMKLAGAFGKTAADRAETRRIQREIEAEFEATRPENSE